jgi:hypothetical protein
MLVLLVSASCAEADVTGKRTGSKLTVHTYSNTGLYNPLGPGRGIRRSSGLPGRLTSR